MQLDGSCCCKSVSFSVESPHPYPFMHCYCSICRKTQGGGGFAVNIGAVFNTLTIDGENNISHFHPMYTNHETGAHEPSPGQRHFCRLCGSGLWVWDRRWPELVHPYASAIDTPLPTPPERHHIFLDSKPQWVQVPESNAEKHHGGYPDLGSLAAWHEQHGLTAT